KRQEITDGHRTIARSSIREAPTQRLTAAEDCDRAPPLADMLRYRERLAPQRHAGFIDREPIELRPIEGREGFQLIERGLLLEDLSVDLEGAGAGEYAGAAARRFLGRRGMRRTVGAEKKSAVARRCGAPQRAPMVLALGDRQTIQMRAYPSCEYRIAVDDQVVGSDCGREV